MRVILGANQLSLSLSAASSSFQLDPRTRNITALSVQSRSTTTINVLGPVANHQKNTSPGVGEPPYDLVPSFCNFPRRPSLLPRARHDSIILRVGSPARQPDRVMYSSRSTRLINSGCWEPIPASNHGDRPS
ncbi:hypothetical protein XANCAGTX0491_009918 [Xanthoria calcicola]